MAPRTGRGLLACGSLVLVLSALGCAKPTAVSASAAPATPTSAPSAPPSAATPQLAALAGGISWRYEVSFEATRELAVEADFSGSTVGTFSADDNAAAFVRSVEYAQGATWLAATAHDQAWLVPCASGCRVRYRFALAEAAHALNDIDTAIASGPVLAAPPSTWLLHPDSSGNHGDFALHVEAGAGNHFVTAFKPVVGRANTYQAPIDTIDDTGFSAIGPLWVHEVPAGDTTVLLGAAPDRLKLSEAEASAWIASSAGAIASYYQGHLPARHTLLLLMQGSGNNTRGETLGGGGPAVLVRASDLVSPSTTRDDWVVTHELFHANFPDIGRAHAWLSEGLATYLEPIARARVGLVTEQKYWRDLVDGLPQGLPEAGDQGLEHTRTWGRTYWGGALFCMMVDLTLREKSGNRHSLDDVLLAIGKTGATDDAFWDIEQVLAAGDRATGMSVLHDLYEQLAQKPGTVDLKSVFARLGVRTQGDSVVFDDAAPLSNIRRSITARSPG